jgi:hypothetical protein
MVDKFAPQWSRVKCRAYNKTMSKAYMVNGGMLCKF